MWCGHIAKSGALEVFANEEYMKQRQAGENFYRLNGAIYIVNIYRFERNRFIYQKGSFAYIMSQRSSIDIDTEMDFRLAEILMEGI